MFGSTFQKVDRITCFFCVKYIVENDLKTQGWIVTHFSFRHSFLVFHIWGYYRKKEECVLDPPLGFSLRCVYQCLFIVYVVV
jgi:hypothetical protein